MPKKTRVVNLRSSSTIFFLTTLPSQIYKTFLNSVADGIFVFWLSSDLAMADGWAEVGRREHYHSSIQLFKYSLVDHMPAFHYHYKHQIQNRKVPVLPKKITSWLGVLHLCVPCV